MTINATKTKIHAVGEQQSNNQPFIMLQNQPLEEVQSFLYLGSEFGQCINAEQEVSVRLEKVGKVYQIWRKKSVLQPSPQHCHQSTRFSDPGVVCAPL